MIKMIMLIFIVMTLSACATMNPTSVSGSSSHQKHWTSGQVENLQQGKRYFIAGYYRRALQQLLPLACDGHPEAQYAIGYLYYNGYGVQPDKEIGLFWIHRAAKQAYVPAVNAERVLSQQTLKK